MIKDNNKDFTGKGKTLKEERENMGKLLWNQRKHHVGEECWRMSKVGSVAGTPTGLRRYD